MMETRRTIIEAREERINPHSNQPERVRHHAVVKECLEDGQFRVYDRLLVEDPQGRYTENGEIRQIGASGGRWRGPTHGWQSNFSSFDELVDHYRYLGEKPDPWPDGWWVPDRRGCEATL